MPLDIGMTEGDKIVDRNFLSNVDIPKTTATYHPVPHLKILNNIEDIMGRYRPEYSLVKESFVTNKSHQRMFFKLYFQAEGKQDMIWGGRNGYDRLTSYAHGAGGGVFVCANMLIRGSDVNYVRKHTRGVWEDIVREQLRTVHSVEDTLERLAAQQDKMKQIELTDRQVYEFFGFLRGTSKLKANQLSTAIEHWNNAPFQEFEERTAWSAYNSVTWAFGKSKDPQTILQQHTDFHDVAEKQWELV